MTNKLKILAIDPGTKCGFAHSCGISGTWDLSVRRDESAGMRLIRLRGKLTEILEDEGVDILVFEANRNMKFGHAIRVSGEIQGVLQVWAIDKEVEYRAYSATELKKHATGKGNAGKDIMLAYAAKKWPKKEFKDDNEVDAVWLLDLAASQFTPKRKKT
jgi:Holliday junction resolvasome RuvABC endonuclease subunit